MSSTERRSFLLGGPFAFAGALFAQDGATQKPIARDVADFWLNKVGLPGDAIEGAIAAAPARPAFRGRASAPDAYGQEPLFLYVDPDENRIVPASEIPVAKLLPGGDATVEMRVTRLRLNSDDHEKLARYEAAGIYLDVAQRQTPELAGALAFAMLGAVFPHKPLPSAANAPAAREPGPVQTIGLPDGLGTSTFCCFLKDRKRSPFGRFANALLELSSYAAADILPLLGMPGLTPPALKVIRGLVFNLQARGDQEWLFQDSPIALACTGEAAASSGAVRLRTGNYLVIPKAHSTPLKASLSDVKVADGFLVPKAAGALDVYDAAPETAKGVSYLSLSVTVKKAKLNRCTYSA